MAKTATTERQAAPVELVQLDPATLTLETNVRTLTKAEQAKIDDLAASIAEVGVYTPLRGVRDQAGQVMVRDGQRRLLAAQQAGVTTVPVVIHPEDTDGDEREAARISQQVLANSGRALTGEDTAAAIDQLSMFGIPADQIATRTGVDRDKVAATVATAESKTVRAQVIEHDMTLEQTNAMLEFEDDEAAMDHLTRAARNGDFDHVLQQLRQLRADAVAREEAAQPYREQGIGVLDRRPYYYEPSTPDGEKLHVVSAYVTENGTPATADDVAAERLWVYLTEDETYHVKGTGEQVQDTEVAWGWTPDAIDEDDEPWELDEGEHDPATIEVRSTWIIDMALTTDPKADGLRKPPKNMAVAPDADPEDAAEALAEAREQAKVERRQLIALNKAADAAETVRREHVTTLLTRKTPPKGAAKLTAQVIAAGVTGRSISEGHDLARELLGVGYATGKTLDSVLGKASDNRAQVISLAHAIATFENAYSRSSWRDRPGQIKPYLDFLVTTGYTPAVVETVITGERTAAEAYDQITQELSQED